MKRVLKVGLALLMAAGMWRYFHSVLIPYQANEAVVHQAPLKNMGDLYPRWLGARELLLHGRDPYGPEVSREIQVGVYGETLDSAKPNLPKDEQRFAYPAYVVFLLAPTITIPFPMLRDVFRVLLVLMTAASVPLWMRGLGLRAERTTTAIITLLLLGSFPVVMALYLEQLTLLVCFLIAASCAALASRRFVLAGVLLALATIKPQIAVAFVAWFGLWALGDWARRKWFAWSFVSAMALLWLGAELILPGWFGRWWAAMHAYLGYNDARSLLETLLGRYPGLLASALVAGGVALGCWRSRRAPAGSSPFNACLLSVLAGSLLIKPKFPLYDVALLLPAVIWLLDRRKDLWQRSRLVRDLFFIAGLLLGWQWISAVTLAMVSLVSHSAAQRGWGLPAAAMFLLPVSLSCLLGVLAVDVWSGSAISLRGRTEAHRELVAASEMR